MNKMIFINKTPWSIEIQDWISHYERAFDSMTPPKKNVGLTLFRILAKKYLDENLFSEEDKEKVTLYFEKRTSSTGQLKSGVTFKFSVSADPACASYEESDSESNLPVLIPYESLTLELLWLLLEELFMMATGISKNPVDPSVSKKELKKEIDTVKYHILYFIFHEQHDLDKIGSIDDRLINRKNLTPSFMFTFIFYYKLKFIESKLTVMNTFMNNKEVKNMRKIKINQQEYTKKENFIRDEIILHNSLVDFTIDTMCAVMDDTMKEEHKIIAIVMVDKKFHVKIPETEVWQRLYGSYFDKCRDYFKEFFNVFRNFCIEYMVKSYLHTNFSLELIPFYHVYTGDNCETYTDDLTVIFDTKWYKMLEKQVYDNYDD